MTSSAVRGQLLRLLGLGFGIAVAVGEMIGSGILRTPSLVAANVGIAGAILALWCFGALHAAMQANVLAELGTMLPRVGGQYVFVRYAFGNAAGLITGWSMWCAHIAGIAASSIAFAEFLALLWPAARGYESLAAVILQLVLYGANLVGLREGRALQVATSLAKVFLLILFAIAAVAIAPSHSLLAGTAIAAPTSLVALGAAYQLIRGAYNGWHAPVYFAEESITPGRNIPRALFAGIALTATLYLAVNAALISSLGSRALAASPLPYLIVLHRLAGAWPAFLFAAGAMIAVTSCANANIMIAPRILLALGRDRLLPKSVTSVNKGGSPDVAFLSTAAFSIALGATGGFRSVFGLIGTLVTLASLLTELAYFRLRQREPALERPWHAVGHPLLPALVIAIDAVLLLLFAMADLNGALLAAALCALSVPAALWTRRDRR